MTDQVTNQETTKILDVDRAVAEAMATIERPVLDKFERRFIAEQTRSIQDLYGPMQAAQFKEALTEALHAPLTDAERQAVMNAVNEARPYAPFEIRFANRPHQMFVARRAGYDTHKRFMEQNKGVGEVEGQERLVRHYLVFPKPTEETLLDMDAGLIPSLFPSIAEALGFSGGGTVKNL